MFSAAKAVRVLLILVLLLGIAALLQERGGGQLQGTGTAIDGDSLRLSGEEIRLSGLDAPEFNQTCGPAQKQSPCGQEAYRFLQRLLKGEAVRCLAEGSDRYDRTLALCRIGEKDLGSLLVGAGQAVATDAYFAEEAKARAGRQGIWAGPFDRPADWRKARQLER